MSTPERRPSFHWARLRDALIIAGVVLAVFAVVYPAFVHITPTPWRSGCFNNLKQIGTAINMYMQDNDDRFPLVSGFGRELDSQTALWGEEGTILNRRGDDIKYMPDLLDVYIRNPKVLNCPSIEQAGMVWKVPGGEVDFAKNGTTYVFNAWYLKKPGSRDPKDRIEIAGQKEDTCASPAEAPLVWDGISGYAPDWNEPVQLPHDSSINVLYADGHVQRLHLSIGKPPSGCPRVYYWASHLRERHFWSVPCRDPGVITTQGARGWWYTLSEVR